MIEQELNSSFLTVDEAAKILRVHRTTVSRLIRTGQLGACTRIRTGKREHWRIPRDALQQLQVKTEVAVEPELPPTIGSFTKLKRFAKSVR